MRRPVAFAALFLAAIAQPATADILRSCNASIEASGLGKPAVTLALLTAKGACKNKANADKCRARAREQLDECLDIVWKDHRFDSELPMECRDGSSGRPGANMAWEGIRLYKSPRSLFREAVHEVCCIQDPSATMKTFALQGSIWGGPGCAASIGGGKTESDFVLVSTFTVDCNHWRKDEKICDRP